MTSAKLRIVFLGTSSAAPTKGRGLPSLAVIREGQVVLMDCGEGAQRAFLSERIGLNKETLVLITHLHGDHVTGLLGLLQSMSLAQRRKPLSIVGPPKLKEWLEVTARLLNIGLTFPLIFIPAKPGVVFRSKDFLVKAAKASHSVEAFSYLFAEKDRPGIFYPKKAKELGVPEGKLWSRLQAGRSVMLKGRTVNPHQVTGRPRRGRRVGYSGDTRPTARLSKFFEGTDLLVFDSTFSAKDRDKAVLRRHSTCLEAAELAAKAGAKKLVLTHFSARYPSVSGLVRQARGVFPATIAANDGLKLEVSYPDS